MATNTNSKALSLDNLPHTFRVGGSGFTAFHWGGHIIGFAQSISNVSPQPVAPPSPIQPLDQRYPMQIIVPAAIGPGTLQVQLFEMYNQKVWDQIMKITDTSIDKTGKGVPKGGIYHDLSDIFLRLSAIGNAINCTKIVYPPNAGVRGGPNVRKHADRYFGCVITDIRDDETINIGTMEVIKNMTIMYRYTRRIHETIQNI